MNWHRKEWYNTRIIFGSNKGAKLAWSNITTPWTERPDSGPFAVKLNSLAEANQSSLRLYRILCRLVPSILHQTTLHYKKDYFMTKRNLAQWFRRAKNMRNLEEIEKLQGLAAESIFDAAYHEQDGGLYTMYLFGRPGDQNELYKADIGINLYDERHFSKKTKFFEKFIKGNRALY